MRTQKAQGRGGAVAVVMSEWAADLTRAEKCWPSLNSPKPLPFSITISITITIAATTAPCVRGIQKKGDLALDTTCSQ